MIPHLYLAIGLLASEVVAGSHGSVAFHHHLPLHKRAQAPGDYHSSVDAKQEASNSAQMAQNSAAKSKDLALQNGGYTSSTGSVPLHSEAVTSTKIVWSTITDWITVIISQGQTPMTKTLYGARPSPSDTGATTNPVSAPPTSTSTVASTSTAPSSSAPHNTGGMSDCTSDSPCTGRITMNPYNVSVNACGNQPLSDVWDNWMTALTTDRFHASVVSEGKSSYCNSMVNIHCPSFGTTVSAMVIDCCGGGCSADNALDLSVSTFTYMTGHNDGNDGAPEQYMCNWYYA